MKKIYLDYAATTPMDPVVVEAMLPFLKENFGNASSIHGFGLQARAALDQSRMMLAEALNAEPFEIIFTSGGTEANNLAILGIAGRYEKPRHVITSAIEHPSVMQACKFLQKIGWRVTFLPVDQYGWVHPENLKEAIAEDTALISIMYANNEIGTIQPIAEMAQIAHSHGIPFHSDMVQAFGKIKMDVQSIPISLVSLAGHKIYGPKGIGALFVRKGIQLRKLFFGGGQENDLRPGTENIAGIRGLAKAVELLRAQHEQDFAHARSLAEKLIHLIQSEIPGAVLNGHRTKRLPWILNFSFPGIENTSLVMGLDLQGIAVSDGSACSSGKVEPSHVLQAMRLPLEIQRSAIRISFGRFTTEDEIEALVWELQKLTRNKVKQNRERNFV